MEVLYCLPVPAHMLVHQVLVWPTIGSQAAERGTPAPYSPWNTVRVAKFIEKPLPMRGSHPCPGCQRLRKARFHLVILTYPQHLDSGQDA
jgi:hypothetical protein